MVRQCFHGPGYGSPQLGRSEYLGLRSEPEQVADRDVLPFDRYLHPYPALLVRRSGSLKGLYAYRAELHGKQPLRAGESRSRAVPWCSAASRRRVESSQ